MQDHVDIRAWIDRGTGPAVVDRLRISVPTAVLASEDDPVIPIDLIRRDVVERIGLQAFQNSVEGAAGTHHGGEFGLIGPIVAAQVDRLASGGFEFRFN